MPEAEKLEIPISGQIVGDISVRGTGWNEEAGAVKLGSVKSSEGKRTNLSVAVRGENAESTKFEVKSVDPPEMKVTLGEPKKLKDGLVQVPVEIEIPPARGRWCGSTRRKAKRGRFCFRPRIPRSKSCDRRAVCR